MRLIILESALVLRLVNCPLVASLVALVALSTLSTLSSTITAIASRNRNDSWDCDSGWLASRVGTDESDSRGDDGHILRWDRARLG